MSSFSAYSISSVRQWKAKISFPYAPLQDLSLKSKVLALFLLKRSIQYVRDSSFCCLFHQTK
ncbi:hypothetical protein [Alteribacillus sp. YIM 98480]|uniref:hypothetical protein n=1 Tax=Alteribacillus sp. YIM 98480 TaxID=2606599 RepID=UPI00131C528E|nr:hypothetical protein [Alteribacillus sp. YIM 98480]